MKKIRSFFAALGRHKWIVYAVIFAGYLIWAAFLDDNNAAVLIRTERRIRAQEAEIRSLKDDIARKQARYESLTSEKAVLEKFAREQYMFHAPGEDVYFVKKID